MVREKAQRELNEVLVVALRQEGRDSAVWAFDVEGLCWVRIKSEVVNGAVGEGKRV